MNRLGKAKAYFLPKVRQVGHFILKQGLAISCNLLYGLLCVRLLPVPEYAKFAVLFGFMGSLTVLLDVGVSATLAPLVGDQITNLQLIADYVASIRRLAVRVYLFVIPLAIPAFFFLVRKQSWGFWVVAQMVAALIFTAWFARVSGCYGAVLILRRDRSYYYRMQILGSLGSLLLLALLWACHSVNIYVCVLLNVAQTIFIAISYFRRAKSLLGVKGHSSPASEKLIIRLALPNMPDTLFYAMQGQITLMLITLVGHTSGVASVGALNRISQILVFASQMNPILIEPFVARLPVARVKRTYLLIAGIVGIGTAAFVSLAFFFPELFLWILGPHYKQLRIEVALVVLASGIRYFAGVLWIMHSARRFIYMWVSITNISCTLLIQAYFIATHDLSTVRGVVLLNVYSACVALGVIIAAGIYGFWHGPQKMDQIPSTEPVPAGDSA
jgi:O-antigen/teichoic acid export membrane protein